MNIQSFKLFCYVVEEGSVSGAARKAFLSQPSVTKNIRQLEKDYDVLLFRREHGVLQLTPSGEKLYEHARAIVLEYENSIEALENEKQLTSSQLYIGASFTLGEYLLPTIMSEFQQLDPETNVHLSISNTPDILDALENQEVDAAFVEGEITNSSLRKQVIAEDEIILIVPPDHSWAGRKNLTAKELSSDRMICREETSSTRKIIEKYLEEKNLLQYITTSMELSTTQAIKSAVQSGLGFGFVSIQTVQQELKAGLLSHVPVADIHISRPLWFVKKPLRFEKTTVPTFLQCAQDVLKGTVSKA